jgi:predicted neuraminidase
VSGRWLVHLDLTGDGGKSWDSLGPLNDPDQFAVIQPAILAHSQEKLQMLCRSRQKVIVESWSEDGGRTWLPMKASSLPNPDSGIDAVKLLDGRSLLAFNPTTRGRTPLAVAVSPDGFHWQEILVLEDQPGEYSYPAVIQTADGMVHFTYTWQRRSIKHVILDPQII